MIEIEKKFPFTEDALARLTDGAEHLKDVTNTDIYYDNAQFELTTNEIWLRTRNGRYELKIPEHELGGKGKIVEHYRELEDEQSIRDELGLDQKMPMKGALAIAGFEPFAKIITDRQKYAKDGFHIDVDTTSFGYKLIEIELMIEEHANQELAEKKLIVFAESHGVSIEFVMGKVLTYIKQHRPEHFRALQEANVI